MDINIPHVPQYDETMQDPASIPIIESVVLVKEYPSVTERYYTLRYCRKIKDKTIEEHCIMFHSNRITLISLGPNHPIIKEKKNIKHINFQISEKVDRLKNRVSGKGKKGAQQLNSDSVLCVIECEDNTRYNVYSCVMGKLVEINKNLIDDPTLILSRPQAEGFIAIILPKLDKIDQWKTEMLTLEQCN